MTTVSKEVTGMQYIDGRTPSPGAEAAVTLLSSLDTPDLAYIGAWIAEGLSDGPAVTLDMGVPDGFTVCFDWEHDGDAFQRTIVATDPHVVQTPEENESDFRVFAEVIQRHPVGSDPYVTLASGTAESYTGSDSFHPAQARELAAALVEAADLAESVVRS